MRELYLCMDDVALLSMLPVPLFRSLIEHHRRSLLEVGLDPSEIPDAEALWDRHSRMPPDLVDAVHRIGELADEDGVDHIVHSAGGPLFAGTIDRVPVVFATRTLLEHPRVFDRAIGRRFVEDVRPFHEFVAQPGNTVLAEPDLLGVAVRIGTALDLRARGPECKIHSWTEWDGVQHFGVTHTGCPRIERLADGERRIVYQTARELVAFERRSMRLRVNTDDPSMTEMLVREFGVALLGTPDGFRDRMVVTLDPLVTQGVRAVAPTPGVISVKLCQVEIASRSAGNEVFTVAGDDVLHRLAGSALPTDQGPVRAARFRLQLRGERRLREVSLRVPYEMAWDWRRWNGTIRGFLNERGFVVGPRPGGPSWLAA